MYFLVESYLTERSQQGSLSEPLPIEAGVSQESKLGPTLAQINLKVECETPSVCHIRGMCV